MYSQDQYNISLKTIHMCSTFIIDHNQLFAKIMQGIANLTIQASREGVSQ